LDKIVPVLAEKIGEALIPLIEDEIKKCIETHVVPIKEAIDNQQKTIDSNKEKICKQYILLDRLDEQVKQNENTIQEHDAELESLYKKLAELESRLESQEQYSRRTNLRFHNVRVPVDNRGQIIHPVNTDDLVMKICKDKLGIELSINDIGRSHVIAKVRDGESQVIVRFLSYRARNQVYSNKRLLKQNEDGIFVTENFTQFRTSLTKTLSKLKYDHKIHAYWISDGRIFAKKNSEGRKKIINNFDDIEDLERQ